MRLLAIDDLHMDDLNLPERPLLTDRSERLGFATRRREGLNGSHFVRVVPDVARWVVLFKCDDDASRNAILAALGGDVTEERRLLAERDDIASTRVVAYGAPVKIVEPNQFDLMVEFEGMDSVWVDETATETTKSFTSVLDRAMHLDVPGNTRTAPKIILTPQAQRTASAGANVGWQFRRRATITNNSDVPWFRYPCRISLGDTTALTPTKAQADGDDVRLWLDGMEIARTLVTWDTAASFIWFIIPALLPGKSMVVDIVYGNGAAVNPPVLAYPDLPPFHLGNSSNPVWWYPADEDSAGNSGLGIWHLSSDTEPITPDYGVPGAWRPVRVVPNPDNTEIGLQYPYDSNGTADALARFHAERYMEEAVIGAGNDYNGVTLYSPLPIIKLRAGFFYTNENSLWAVNLHYRNSSSEDWAYTSLLSSVVTNSTVAPADYTLPSPSHHIAVTVGPQNNWAMNPTTDVDESITARADEEWIITLDNSDMDISLGSEEEIYELATELRLGGGEDFTPPYRALLIGNARDESGAGTPRAAVVLSQALVIDTDDFTHEVFDRVPWTPTDLGDKLIAWLDASDPAMASHPDGGLVGTWVDRSGNGNDAVNTVSGERPTFETNEQNGLPVIRFDGVDNDLQIADIPLASQPFAVVMAVKEVGASSTGRFFSNDAGNILAIQSGVSGVDAVMNSGSSLTYSVGGLTGSAFRLHVLYFNGASSFGELNGTRVTGNAGTNVDATQDISIGSGIGGTNFEQMDIGEFWVINAALTDAEVDQINGYLAHKWGVTASLPASHPYAGFAPAGAALSEPAERMPAHAVSGVTGWDDDGEAAESPTNDWLPLRPTRAIVPNGDFGADIGGWMAGIGATASVTRTWDGAVGGQEVGSLAIAVSGATLGQQAQIVNGKWFAVNGRESVDLAAWVRTSDADWVPRLQIVWSADGETVLTTDTHAVHTPVVNVPYEQVLSALAPTRATAFRVGLLAYANGASTGTIWLDDVRINDNDLIVTDSVMDGGGELNVAVQLKGRWL